MARRTQRRQRSSRRETPPRYQPRGQIAAVADRPASTQAKVALAFGILATIALPVAYQWTFRPSSQPPGAGGLIQIFELVGILAATAALFLGRRARAAGDRTTGAVWAPRLGGAAIVGYLITVVVFILQSG